MQLGILGEHNVNEIHNVQGFYDCIFKAFLQKGRLISAMAAVIVFLQSRFNVRIEEQQLHLHSSEKVTCKTLTFRELSASYF